MHYRQLFQRRFDKSIYRLISGLMLLFIMYSVYVQSTEISSMTGNLRYVILSKTPALPGQSICPRRLIICGNL